MSRLMAGGLSRREAIHTIGSVLAEHIYGLLSAREPQNDTMARYNAAVDKLAVKSGRKR